MLYSDTGPYVLGIEYILSPQDYLLYKKLQIWVFCSIQLMKMIMMEKKARTSCILKNITSLFLHTK